MTKFGYTLLLANSDGSADRERVYLDTFRAEGVAGLLAVPSQNDERGFRQFLETGVPLVILDRTVHLPNVDIVTVTNREGAGARRAAPGGAGPQRIAMMAGLEAHNVGSERRAGFFAAMEAAGLRPTRRSSRTARSNARPRARPPSSCSIFPSLPPPSSAPTTPCRSACCRRCTSEATRPDDVSIVGFDDMPWQVAMQPPLTCIAQPTYDIGATAARLLLERIAEPERPVRRVVLETALVVRASSARPPR